MTINQVNPADIVADAEYHAGHGDVGTVTIRTGYFRLVESGERQEKYVIERTGRLGNLHGLFD